MSIREDALAGSKTDLLRRCAENESMGVDDLVAGVAAGCIAVPKNSHHNFAKVMAIGKGTTTKVNANIGSSRDLANLDEELEKLRVAVKAGTDTVMDLSMGGDLDAVRRGILANCPVPLGTVPIYQAVAETVEQQGRELVEVTVDHMFKTIEKQAMDGVDFMTNHCGITRHPQERIEEDKTDQGAPETARYCPGFSSTDDLMQLDLAILVLGCHHGIFQVNEILLLHLEEFQPDLFRLEQVIIANYH